MTLQTLTDSNDGTVFPGTDDCVELIDMGKQNDFCKEMVAREVARVRNLAHSNGMDPYVTLYSEVMQAIGVTSN